MEEPENEKEEAIEPEKIIEENATNDIKSDKEGIPDSEAIIKRQRRKEGFLESLDNGVSVLKASKAAGIAYKTIWRWRKDDPDFDAEILSIQDSRIMIVEDALFLNAAKGNLGAQIFWLKNRSGGRWKDKTEEDVTLNVKGGLDFNEYKFMKEMTPDERKQYTERLSKVCGSGNSKNTDADQGRDKE